MCVLLLPFLEEVDVETLDIENYIGLNWKEKLKVVFHHSDAEYQKVIEKLRQIKEDLRNPLTHGYFLKDGGAFYAHVKYLGAIPVTLTKKQKNLHFGFTPIQEVQFSDLLTAFDTFHDHLTKHEKTKYGYRFIQTGLSVAFDKDSVERYRISMASDDLFDNMLDRVSMEHDNAANMDW